MATLYVPEAGDIVMMGAPLKPLPLLVRLSRETVRIIRQNIVIFAFGVNGVGVLVTAWLLALTGILLAYGYWGWALLTLAGAVGNSVLAYRVFRAARR